MPGIGPFALHTAPDSTICDIDGLPRTNDEVVRTILDPDMIRRDAKKPGSKIILYRFVDDKMAVLIVVERTTNLEPSNRVVTAFDVRPIEIRRRARLEELLWKR